VVFKKVLLIVSPVSRPSWVDRYIPSVVHLLNDKGIKVEKAVTKSHGDPARFAQKAIGVFDAVIIAGGDGSINEVINSLVGTDTPVGIIPMGTVNVLSRELGIPINPLGAVQTFVSGQARPFDLGKIGSRYFLLMASYGFDAKIMQHNRRLLKAVMGRYSYVLTSLFLIPRYKDSPIKLYLDGARSSIQANFVIFSNGRRYAGNYLAAPDADMHDGLLDVVYSTTSGRLGLIKNFLAFSRSRPYPPWIMSKRAKRIRVEASDLTLFQVDGDQLSPDSMEINAASDAILLVAP